MAQRHMCPSMGALRCLLVADASAILNCSTRGLHNSAKRLEEQPSDASPAARPETRRTRSAVALRQITNLQNRKVFPGAGALARGSFPSGQMARRGPPRPTTEPGFLPEDDRPTDSQPDATPRFARNAGGLKITRASAPPQGQMVRAPTTPRVGDTARGPNVRGPNLRGRDGGKPGGPRSRGGPGGNRKGGNNNRGDGGPKKRGSTAGGDGTLNTKLSEVDLGSTISDKMSQHLLRLQRKEWDRVPYEPKYAKDSFAANELILAGREFFKGEVPPIKIWGPLEKQIGVVGMWGAEAHLKIRRVGDDSGRWGYRGDEPQPGEKVSEEAMEIKGVEKKAALP